MSRKTVVPGVIQLIQDKKRSPFSVSLGTVAIWKPERHVRNASHCGSKQQ